MLLWDILYYIYCLNKRKTIIAGGGLKPVCLVGILHGNVVQVVSYSGVMVIQAGVKCRMNGKD